VRTRGLAHPDKFIFQSVLRVGVEGDLAPPRMVRIALSVTIPALVRTPRREIDRVKLGQTGELGPREHLRPPLPRDNFEGRTRLLGIAGLKRF